MEIFANMDFTMAHSGACGHQINSGNYVYLECLSKVFFHSTNFLLSGEKQITPSVILQSSFPAFD